MKVTELGAKADPDVDDIRVDNKRIKSNQLLIYVALNKPIGYVTTVSDKHAKLTVMDLVKGINTRIYPVGRLDADSAGILILTNDGDFTEKMTHPRHQVPKTYRVIVRELVPDYVGADLRKGILLEDGITAPADVEWVDFDEQNNVSIIDITIREGRNRQVRRMFEAVGYPVLALTRMSIGPITSNGLAPGTWRKLSSAEVKSLLNESGEEARPTPSTRQVDAHPMDEKPMSQALKSMQAKSRIVHDKPVDSISDSEPDKPAAKPIEAKKPRPQTPKSAPVPNYITERLRKEAEELARKMNTVPDDSPADGSPRKFVGVSRMRKKR